MISETQESRWQLLTQDLMKTCLFLGCLWETLQKYSYSLLEELSPGQITFLLYSWDYKKIIKIIIGAQDHLLCTSSALCSWNLERKREHRELGERTRVWGLTSACSSTRRNKLTNALSDWSPEKKRPRYPLRPLALSVTKRDTEGLTAPKDDGLVVQIQMSLKWEDLWPQLAVDIDHIQYYRALGKSCSPQ